MKIHVKCNGKQQEWDVTPNEYLADTLRSHGCPSVKISCGDGACGTCTVLLNGKPIVSCRRCRDRHRRRIGQRGG